MRRTAFFSSDSASDLGILILRLLAGGLLLTHGIPKLQKLFNGDFQFADPLGAGPHLSLIFAVLAEVVCSVLVILGLFMRIAVIPIILTMAVAFFIVHAADPFSVKELSLAYLSVFLSLFFIGPGIYSLDARRK